MIDMSDFFDGDWEISATYNETTTVKIDFVKQTVTESFPNTDIIVQPASNEELKKASLDTDIEALLIYTQTQVKMKNTFSELDDPMYAGKSYNIISIGNFNPYGFMQCIAEEIND